MTSIGTLYLFACPTHPQLNKMRVAAKYAGVTWDAVAPLSTDPDYVNNLHPLGKNPALQTPLGSLFGSHAIVRHIARLDKTNALYGKSAFEAGKVDQWVDFALAEIDTFSRPIYSMVLGYLPTDEAAIASHTENLLKSFAGLELWLENKTFLVGERITIADIVMLFEVDAVYRYAPTALKFYSFPNVLRYYESIMNQPTVLAALDDDHPKAVAKKPTA